jgi:hypothetical protein
MTDGPVLETRLAPPTPAASPAPLERRFTVGGVVGRTVEVWWRHLLPFTLMSGVVYAPFAAAFALAGAVLAEGAPGGALPPGGGGLARIGAAFAAASVATIALAVVQAGAVTVGTVRHLNGERARLGEMLSVGLRRGLPVVAAGFVVWLAVLAGTLLLVIPGVVVMVATSVAVPAAVVERKGAVGAFRRSLALTRGYRWPLFAAGFVLVVVVSVLSAIGQAVASVLASLVLPAEHALAASLVLSQLGNALFSAIPTVGISVAYHDLRVAKEGVDTDALARVFE